ncbi:hypothetical protein ACP70R_009876 [Stipagrostis hirtigluma subsp. patula]
MAIERCRIWWPREQLQLEQESGSVRFVLFGWLFTAAGSLDIVVSAAVPQDRILRSFATLETLLTIVLSSNKRMPVSLQESATFTILGDCGLHLPGELEEDCCSKQEKLPSGAPFVQKEHFGTSTNNGTSESVWNGDHPSYNHKIWGYDSTLDGFLDTCRKSAVKEGNWVHLFCKSGKSSKSKLNQVPGLRHLYLDGKQIEIIHWHVILYDVPTIGRNHFSLGVDTTSKLKASFKMPKWINDLQKKPSVLDLDPIVLALNCSNAARLPVTQECATSSSGALFCLSIQMSQYLMLQKIFRHSWNNIHLRGCQILYWPIVLQDTSLSSTVNVEYAHKAATQKHGLWSNIIVDLLMGIILGAAFLLNTESICAWTIGLVHYMTEAILRSGCVWLMGVPAGFKLNTELAELLGMISLNAIQIYSTLWFFVGGFLRRIIQGIAFSGIILGLTVPISFLIDIIQLATLHVTVLHWLISMIYSRQIQTVASLWRLFRGRKWNPLRQRLDSYDYTVEQHVVGSLLFTPVLLLIPTTSVFYIFFSILTTTVICLCVMLEVVISVIHSTPYAELILWVTRRKRFPAGLLLVHVPSSCRRTYEDDDLSGCAVSGCSERKTEHLIHGQPGLVSELHCNYATLAQRVPSTLHLQLSPSFQWMNIGITEYWMRCHGSVLSCAPRR